MSMAAWRCSDLTRPERGAFSPSRLPKSPRTPEKSDSRLLGPQGFSRPHLRESALFPNHSPASPSRRLTQTPHIPPDIGSCTPKTWRIFVGLFKRLRPHSFAAPSPHPPQTASQIHPTAKAFALTNSCAIGARRRAGAEPIPCQTCAYAGGGAASIFGAHWDAIP